MRSSLTSTAEDRRAGAAVGRIVSGLAKTINFPVAILFALVGQFVVGWLMMALTPPHDPASPGDTGGAVSTLALLLLLQVGALLFSLSRAAIRPARVFVAVAAVIWAISSMLLIYIALQCDLAGVCL